MAVAWTRRGLVALWAEVLWLLAPFPFLWLGYSCAIGSVWPWSPPPLPRSVGAMGPGGQPASIPLPSDSFFLTALLGWVVFFFNLFFFCSMSYMATFCLGDLMFGSRPGDAGWDESSCGCLA